MAFSALEKEVFWAITAEIQPELKKLGGPYWISALRKWRFTIGYNGISGKLEGGPRAFCVATPDGDHLKIEFVVDFAGRLPREEAQRRAAAPKYPEGQVRVFTSMANVPQIVDWFRTYLFKFELPHQENIDGRTHDTPGVDRKLGQHVATAAKDLVGHRQVDAHNARQPRLFQRW